MDWLLFLIFFAACAAAGATGAMFPPGAWYKTLKKPSFTPPDWVFPVAWTSLYVCMSVAGARAGATEGGHYALALWALQIAVNALWSPVFFGLRKIKAGMWIVLALWVSVAACMVALWQVDWIAGALFAPYLLWCTIASALNAEIWRLNPDEARAPSMPGAA